MSRPSDRRRRLVVPAAVALVAAIATAAAVLVPHTGDAPTGSGSGASSTAPSDAPSSNRGDDVTEALKQLARRRDGDPTALGKVDAPVVLIAYSEFQCPFCGKFARDTEPTLIKRFVDTGTLRIEWRDFPYLGPESTTAALAARAAGAQGKFWQYHDALYAKQVNPNSGALNEKHLVDVARSIGLDVARFRTDLASKATSAAVQRDFDEGQAIGVTGTPAFLVNGQPIIGAQPTETFVQAIQYAASAAQ
ncbi:MAG TPA: thioredoxin domain-containing protein [Angustibacter sp.]|nr:thioredoxin domain-containing protein [Angustibacter sp.]